MNLRTSQMPIAASSAITMTFAIMLANAPPRPKCDSSAAMPRPAARPAIGPSQRERLGCAAGAGAAGFARCACDGAACCIGCCAGGVAWRCVTVEFWRPMLRPPPMRLASASSDANVPAVSRPTISSVPTRRLTASTACYG